MTPQTKKEIKAFAIIINIKDGDDLGVNGIIEIDKESCLQIFENKSEAKIKEHSKIHKVIPCTITYNLPQRG